MRNNPYWNDPNGNTAIEEAKRQLKNAAIGRDTLERICIGYRFLQLVEIISCL